MFGIRWRHLLTSMHEEATTYRAGFKDPSPRSDGRRAVDGTERLGLIVSEAGRGVLELEGPR